MSNFVKVIDALSGTVLFQTSIEKHEEAYAFAAQMEEAGLDIKIETPGLTETLIRSLGANDEEITEHKKVLENEIASHNESDFGCAVCPPKSIK